MFLFVSLVLTAVVASWVAWRVKNRAMLRKSRDIPGPPTVPGLGNALSFMGPPERISDVIGEMRQQYGDVFRFWLGPDLNVIVSDPEEAKSLLSNNKTSTKGPQYKYMTDYCGQGILSGSGPVWRKRRKVVIPNYGRRAVQSYEVVFNQEADVTVERLKKIPEGKTFDIYDDIVRGTTYTVCQTLMGLTREQTLKLPYLEAVITESHDQYLIVFKRMTKWYLQIDLLYYLTKLYHQQQVFIKKMLDLGDSIVRLRLKILETMTDEKKRELLDSKSDEKSNTELSVVDRLVLSNQIPEYDEILKELFTAFTSSQEATAKITSYLLQMMAYHPECQEKLYAEIQDVLDANEKDVTDEHIKQMTYLDMVFKEVIRLFPIGVMLQRTLTEDIKLRNVTLPAGCSLVIPIFHMQRDKRYWENPNAFNPERFEPCKPIPEAYLPFSHGPMDCLGRYFGTKLVKTVSVKILREFRLTSPERYEDMRLVMAVSVASVNGYPVQLHPRNVIQN
ncbi:cytochrome P450 4C1-like [Choristoneura fumiferana]|uniref:cytochrome P450 4C1-like n=1 Tax=Choristoneura fumiferana TaxID=7141 RepID=UPI003D15410C